MPRLAQEEVFPQPPPPSTQPLLSLVTCWHHEHPWHWHVQLETADALATAKTDEVYQLQDAVFDLKKLQKKTKDEVGREVVVWTTLMVACCLWHAGYPGPTVLSRACASHLGCRHGQLAATNDLLAERNKELGETKELLAVSQEGAQRLHKQLRTAKEREEEMLAAKLQAEQNMELVRAEWLVLHFDAGLWCPTSGFHETYVPESPSTPLQFRRTKIELKEARARLKIQELEMSQVGV